MMYEHITLFKGSLNDEEVKNEINGYKKYFKKNNIRLEESEYIGLKKTAYEIKGNNEAHYVKFCFEADTDKIIDFERCCRINDNIIKFMTINVSNELEVDNSVLHAIEDSEESNLYKGIAEEVIFQIDNENSEGREIKLNLDDVTEITEKIYNSESFNQYLNEMIIDCLKEKYQIQENVEEETM